MVEDINTTLWIKTSTRKEFDKRKKKISNILNVEINNDKAMLLLMMGFNEETFKENYVSKMHRKTK